MFLTLYSITDEALTSIYGVDSLYLSMPPLADGSSDLTVVLQAIYKSGRIDVDIRSISSSARDLQAWLNKKCY